MRYINAVQSINSLQYLVDDSAHLTDLAHHGLMQLQVLGEVCRFLRLLLVLREAPEGK